MRWIIIFLAFFAPIASPVSAQTVGRYQWLSDKCNIIEGQRVSLNDRTGKMDNWMPAIVGALGPSKLIDCNWKPNPDFQLNLSQVCQGEMRTFTRMLEGAGRELKESAITICIGKIMNLGDFVRSENSAPIGVLQTKQDQDRAEFIKRLGDLEGSIGIVEALAAKVEELEARIAAMEKGK
jgi:hypothetical protein